MATKSYNFWNDLLSGMHKVTHFNYVQHTWQGIVTLIRPVESLQPQGRLLIDKCWLTNVYLDCSIVIFIVITISLLPNLHNSQLYHSQSTLSHWSLINSILGPLMQSWSWSQMIHHMHMNISDYLLFKISKSPANKFNVIMDKIHNILESLVRTITYITIPNTVSSSHKWQSVRQMHLFSINEK